jgi:uncharacterized repeat protein (TIGR02543 family)
MMNQSHKNKLVFAALLLALASCNGTSISSEYNVYFFTANTAAVTVDTIFNQEVGDLIERPENPTRPGFDFLDWYLDLEYTTPWIFETDVMPQESIVLYAKWAPTIRSIEYELNGGEMVDENYPTTFVPGQSFVLPQARRTGFLFRGWYLYEQILENFPNNEGTKPGDPSLTTVPSSAFENLQLFAHWSAIKVVLTLRPSHPSGTTVVPNPSNRIIAYGSIIDYGTNFPADYGIVNGYQFMGWNSRLDGTGTWYPNGGIFIRTLAITLYGQWQLV